MEVFKGGVLCTALKCGVPQMRLNLKLNLEWGAPPAAVSCSPCAFMWLWSGLFRGSRSPLLLLSWRVQM